jgi:carbon-monoxide dehydrogenase medium subunit
MYQTNYVRASSTDDAVAKLDDEAKLLAGGMTLLPTMKQRLASPETLIDLADCGLAGIEDLGDALKIGAMTRHVDVETSEIVVRSIPALAVLAAKIGDRQGAQSWHHRRINRQQRPIGLLSFSCFGT